MSKVIVKGSVSRIALRAFDSAVSYIRVNYTTYEFMESALTRSVLAMTEKGDHVELTFSDEGGPHEPLMLMHINNKALEESAGHDVS